MKKALIVLALVFLLVAPSYAAVQESETGVFNTRVKTFLNKAFTSNKVEKEAPTILKTETAPVTSKRGEQGMLSSPNGEASMQRMTVRINESFRISLEANATTGYRWNVDFDEMDLILLNTSYITESAVDQSNVGREIVGRGGKRIYTFRAIKEGTTKLVFSYVSPGNETTAEQKTYIINVVSENVISDINVQPSIESDDNTQPSIGVESSVESDNDVRPSTNVRPSIKNLGSKVRSLFSRSDITAPVGPGEFRPADESQVSQEVREKLELRREEVRQKIQFNQGEIEAVKIEVQKRIQEKRAELNEKLQQIRSEQKRRAAEQVHQNLYNVREKILNNFSRNTNRLETVLTNITTRADKMEAEGVNVENVREAIQDTQLQINSAQEQIRNLFQKEYDIQITGEKTLRKDFRIIRDELHNDLSDVKNIVKEAYQATRSAAMELTQSK